VRGGEGGEREGGGTEEKRKLNSKGAVGTKEEVTQIQEGARYV